MSAGLPAWCLPVPLPQEPDTTPYSKPDTTPYVEAIPGLPWPTRV